MADDKRELVETTRAELAAIVAEGAAAAGARKLVTACPYSAAGDATERVRVQAWLRGFLGH